MTVQELIERLGHQDPNAQVLVMMTTDHQVYQCPLEDIINYPETVVLISEYYSEESK